MALHNPKKHHKDALCGIAQKICYCGCCHGDTSLNDNNNDTFMFMFQMYNVFIVFVMVAVELVSPWQPQ